MPLLHEYDGLCHAAEGATGVPAEFRFKCCNHGYSRGCCSRFPETELRSGFRYTVVGRTSTGLEVMCVEEQQFAPLRWHSVEFLVEGERLEPELSDRCMRAQVLAFCRSYLKRFPASSE